MFFGFPQVLHNYDSIRWESQQKPHESSKKKQNHATYDPRCSMYFFFNLHVSFTIIYSQQTIQMLVKIGQSHGSHGARCCSPFAFGGGDLKAFFVSDDPASRWASIERLVEFIATENTTDNSHPKAR